MDDHTTLRMSSGFFLLAQGEKSAYRLAAQPARFFGGRILVFSLPRRSFAFSRLVCLVFLWARTDLSSDVGSQFCQKSRAESVQYMERLRRQFQEQLVATDVRPGTQQSQGEWNAWDPQTAMAASIRGALLVGTLLTSMRLNSTQQVQRYNMVAAKM